jgi:hypothetical protein
MKYFREYILNQQDDSPLYVFEGSLEQSDMRELLNNYHVPEYFTEDLFGMVPFYYLYENDSLVRKIGHLIGTY